MLDDGEFTKDHQAARGIKYSKRRFTSFCESAGRVVPL